jgi:uncharacterized membrane protein YphA (DoxX/SURF4 family)
MAFLGWRAFSLGVIGLGLVELISGSFAPGWLPVSPHLPSYHLLARASGVALVLGGCAINIPRLSGLGALGVAIFFAATMALVHLPHTLAKPADWVGWQAVAESTAMAMGALLALAQSPRTTSRRVAGIARLVFGVCLLIFGVSHFVYAKFTASLVPAWLPPSQLFWTYATGVAQIAAGLAILSGMRARLAAILLTAMYGVFGVLVHLPSIIEHPASQDNWTENAINLILLGAAWCVADTLRTKSQAAP